MFLLNHLSLGKKCLGKIPRHLLNTGMSWKYLMEPQTVLMCVVLLYHFPPHL